MRFDVPVPCFFGADDFCDAIRKIGRLGFDAAETYSWQGLDFDSVRAACEESGVELVSICTSFFNMTEPACRKEWLENLEKSCEAACRLGAGKLITQVGNDTGRERAFQHESIVCALREAKPILEEYGRTLMLEPLNVLIDHKGYYLVSSSEAFDIVDEADCGFVKVVYDIYHQQISEGNIIPTIKANLGKIAHLHCAGHPGRHELQYGENDYRNIFAAVDEAGYDGCCGLEYGPLLPPEESLEEFKRIYL